MLNLKLSTILRSMLGTLIILPLAWIGYGWNQNRQGKADAQIASDHLCATAIISTLETQSKIDFLTAVKPDTSSRSVVITTPELDAEIIREFQIKGFQGTAEVEDLAEKVAKLIQSVRQRAPEVAKHCELMNAAMLGCLPDFPYLSSGIDPQCKAEHIIPAAQTLSNYLRRNFRSKNQTYH